LLDLEREYPMKEWSTLETKSQSEALINEFKGNLLEYLLAIELAQEYNCEAEFIFQLDESYRNQLLLYENELRSFDPILIKKLPEIARRARIELVELLGKKFKHVTLLGKAGQLEWKKYYREADLLLDDGKKQVPLSLKLCQYGALVNTKSGGVRTFIEHYFNCDDITEKQNQLNLFLDQSFQQMAGTLYELAGLEYQSGFDDRWKDAGFSDLPGQLPVEFREILYQHYHRVIQKMYSFLSDIYREDPESFSDSLFELVGMGHRDLVQLMCFHQKEGEDRYNIAAIEINTLNSWKDAIEQLKFEELKENVSYFNLNLGDKELQIRVKPMNVFTVPGLKINCSVKNVGQKRNQA
jgi:hypothetical protein